MSRFLTPTFWGPYSGVPLIVALDEGEVEKLKNEGVIFISVSFITYQAGEAVSKTVELRRHYKYKGLAVDSVNIDLGAVFKAMVFYYGDVNVRLETRQYNVPTIEVGFRAMYNEGGRMVDLALDGGVSEERERFKIYPATFSQASQGELESLNGRRICKDFGVGSHYTTYFKGYPQMDMTLVVKKEGYDVAGVVVNAEPRYDYKYIDRVIDDCGLFVAWRNSAGCFSYWLFSEERNEEIRTKGLGQIFRGHRNGYAERDTLVHSLGCTAVRRWTLKSTVPVMEAELDELQGILSSNEVFIFTGVKKSDNDGRAEDYGEWKRVLVVEGTHKFDINRQGAYPFSITIEFEEDRTITAL